MNTTIQNLRILPEVDSMKNVIYTVEVKIDKEVEGKSKSIFRTYTLEPPIEANFVSIDLLSKNDIMQWIQPLVQNDSVYIEEYFNSFNMTVEDKKTKQIESLSTFIDKQEKLLENSRVTLNKLKEDQNT